VLLLLEEIQAQRGPAEKTSENRTKEPVIWSEN
jgi:hypothetical protein